MVEEKLIASLRAGREEALIFLYDNYSAVLYGAVLRIVRSPEIAQDVMQDSFVKIWKNAPYYDPTKSRLFTWMFNIAKHTAIDTLRSADWKKRQKTDDLATIFDLPAPSAKPEHVDIRRIVDTLEPKYRLLIDLVYFQGYTHQELEEKLQMPLGTIKTRLRAAVLHLRKIFDLDYSEK